MSFWSYPPYVPVAQRRAQAAKEVAKLKKKGRVITPVVLDGRKIAQSFWGKAWCDNLERYSDFETRLPRGRTYVRNGSVVDLQIAKGKITALVSGSQIYEIDIAVTSATPGRWKAICRDCAGSIASLVELLKGKISKNVMERVCRESDGLFPAPREIKMSCSCPDGAEMCKHVAATLYGVGARLDAQPELLFLLRGVDSADLVSNADAGATSSRPDASQRIIAQDDVAALFGIDMSPMPIEAAPSPREAATIAGPGATRKAAGPTMAASKEPESKSRKAKSPSAANTSPATTATLTAKQASPASTKRASTKSAANASTSRTPIATADAKSRLQTNKGKTGQKRSEKSPSMPFDAVAAAQEISGTKRTRVTDLKPVASPGKRNTPKANSSARKTESTKPAGTEGDSRRRRASGKER
ncbi:hypothetical protein [Methylocystis sp. JR02]|uniref:SWIM zinc finger family protein n=1 Tax=Methylocystis sp. JR02 TaxID=3046284 RepID=UPI0024BA07D2|nr:hypothetical protein [Methylocystis sp. JR02]MDJ0447131.1 hypothetical protein [Methylocystis sp. JR02]